MHTTNLNNICIRRFKTSIIFHRTQYSFPWCNLNLKKRTFDQIGKEKNKFLPLTSAHSWKFCSFRFLSDVKNYNHPLALK